MSQETLHDNPIMDKAFEHRQAVVDATQDRYERQDATSRRNSRSPKNMEEVLGGPLLDIEDGIANLRLGIKQKRAERAARKHYQENNGVYYDAAVAEAANDGVQINVQQLVEAEQQIPVHVAEQAGKKRHY